MYSWAALAVQKKRFLPYDFESAYLRPTLKEGV